MMTAVRQRWRRFIVSHRGFVNLQWMGDRMERFSYTHDPEAGTVRLIAVGTTETFALTSATVGDDRLVLEGPFRDGQVRVELKKVPARSFPLHTRGFNWIRELPFNR